MNYDYIASLLFVSICVYLCVFANVLNMVKYY